MQQALIALQLQKTGSESSSIEWRKINKEEKLNSHYTSSITLIRITY